MRPLSTRFKALFKLLASLLRGAKLEAAGILKKHPFPGMPIPFNAYPKGQASAPEDPRQGVRAYARLALISATQHYFEARRHGTFTADCRDRRCQELRAVSWRFSALRIEWYEERTTRINKRYILIFPNNCLALVMDGTPCSLDAVTHPPPAQQPRPLPRRPLSAAAV